MLQCFCHCRCSLRSLAKQHLGVDIQLPESASIEHGVEVEATAGLPTVVRGHDSVEDARSAMALLHAKLLQHPKYGGKPGLWAWHVPSDPSSWSAFSPDGCARVPWNSGELKAPRGAAIPSFLSKVPHRTHVGDVQLVVSPDSLSAHAMLPHSSFINTSPHDIEGTLAKVRKEAARVADKWHQQRSLPPSVVVGEVNVCPREAIEGKDKSSLLGAEGKPGFPHSVKQLQHLESQLQLLLEALPRHAVAFIVTGPGWDKPMKSEEVPPSSVPRPVQGRLMLWPNPSSTAKPHPVAQG